MRSCTFATVPFAAVPFAAVLLLLPAPTLLAQQGARAEVDRAAAVLALVTPTQSGCPVEFAARHADAGRVLSVGNPAQQQQKQAYRLTFTPRGSNTIAQVRVTLHGIAGPHVLPAQGGAKAEAPQAGAASATESFTLAQGSGTHGLFHTTVYTEKLTGVQTVELNDLTYADGTVWHESASTPCRVVPNGFLLVAGQ